MDNPHDPMFDDLEPRYAPTHVITARGGVQPVTSSIFHPAGTHRGPIKSEVAALELKTAAGSRWYGCVRAYINSELRMVVIGASSRDEVRARWPIVPERMRDTVSRAWPHVPRK
jgi:hypothetical protein